ncbi:helix-turn-helix domain-containing protein [Cupriavidus sp. 2TAF22]|uniref:helix-turn-helix domain-containing protein n=1 Tax=unclassified Cupriavidus TaxID=2640874 RepID=UPI003F93AD9E
MSPLPLALSSANASPQASRLQHSRFEVGGPAHASANPNVSGQILTWRQRVGHVMDLHVSRDSLIAPFHGAIDRYLVGDMLFTDSRCDGVTLQRSLARISTDTMRHHVLQVFVEGSAGEVEGMQRNPVPRHGGILLTDLGQPIQMQRGTTRALSIFVPRAMMDTVFAEAEAAHGRIVETDTPLTRLAVDHARMLERELPRMAPEAAADAMQIGVELLVAAFRRGAKLEGSARSAARSAMLARARRLIDADPGEAGLSPANLLAKMEISRPTLYRLFEDEGGVQAYIRKSRLRAAALELVRYPRLAVNDIAYGLGFNSASDFTRAFRRTLGMSPSDLRAYATDAGNTGLRQAALALQGEEFRRWLHRQQA